MTKTKSVFESLAKARREKALNESEKEKEKIGPEDEELDDEDLEDYNDESDEDSDADYDESDDESAEDSEVVLEGLSSGEISIGLCSECGSVEANKNTCSECGGELTEKMKMVVRGGKIHKKIVKKKVKRILSASQKAALVKARAKAHSAAANLSRKQLTGIKTVNLWRRPPMRHLSNSF